MEGFTVHYKRAWGEKTYTWRSTLYLSPHVAERTFRSWLNHFRKYDYKYWHIRSASGHIIAMSKGD